MTDSPTYQKMPKNAKTHICEKCDFKCSKLSNYKSHLTTLKHLRLINTYLGNAKMPHQCKCGKSYKHSQSLYNHKKRCINDETCQFIDKDISNTIISLEDIENSKNDDIDYKALVVHLIKENTKINTLMVNQQQQLIDILPHVGNTTNNTNNIKQRFNIQVFLNEKCKDALSMDEFIDKLEISMKNLLTTKDKGLSEGVSNIIIDNMNKLSVYERPIHCTDKKRETVYVKNDEWAKDENMEGVNHLLKQTEFKQMKNINQWTNEHPGYADDDQLQREYINLVTKCTSSIEACKDKVIKKVCDNVYLTEKE